MRDDDDDGHDDGDDPDDDDNDDTVFGLAPSIRSPVEIINVTRSSVLISWSSAAGASYYRVSVDGNIISTVDSNVTSLPVPQLRSGTRYTFSVTVYDSDDMRGNTVRAHVMTGNVLHINFDLLLRTIQRWHGTEICAYLESFIGQKV